MTEFERIGYLWRNCIANQPAPTPAPYVVYCDGAPYFNGSAIIDYHFVDLALDFARFARSLEPAHCWTVVESETGQPVPDDLEAAKWLEMRDRYEARELAEA